MEEKNKALDFKNQEFHIGIDNHKNSWKVTIISQIELKTYSANPSPEELSQYLRKNYLSFTRFLFQFFCSSIIFHLPFKMK